MIVHRCICGHPDIFHVVPRNPRSECSYSWCPSDLHRYGPPEIIPSWDATGKRVEEIVPPGSRLMPYPLLCDCADCLALYARTRV